MASEKTSKGSDIKRRYTCGGGGRAPVNIEVLKDMMIAMKQSCFLTVGGQRVWFLFYSSSGIRSGEKWVTETHLQVIKHVILEY